MTKKELVNFHQRKLNYNIDSNKELRNTLKSLKTGQHKVIYDELVRKYRKNIRFHREAISLLETLN